MSKSKAKPYVLPYKRRELTLREKAQLMLAGADLVRTQYPRLANGKVSPGFSAALHTRAVRLGMYPKEASPAAVLATYNKGRMDAAVQDEADRLEREKERIKAMREPARSESATEEAARLTRIEVDKERARRQAAAKAFNAGMEETARQKNQEAHELAQAEWEAEEDAEEAMARRQRVTAGSATEVAKHMELDEQWAYDLDAARESQRIAAAELQEEASARRQEQADDHYTKRIAEIEAAAARANQVVADMEEEARQGFARVGVGSSDIPPVMGENPFVEKSEPVTSVAIPNPLSVAVVLEPAVHAALADLVKQTILTAHRLHVLIANQERQHKELMALLRDLWQ